MRLFLVRFDFVMNIQYLSYTIALFNDDDYIPDSADNANRYQFVYFEDNGFRPPSKHGIRVSENGVEISSAILFGEHGATTIHGRSYLIKQNVLFICCGDSVYALDLPTLDLKWKKQLDMATCFGLYDFNDAIIVHGEVEISKITLDGEVNWQFSGRDIFVNLNGESILKIENSTIIAVDFEGYRYKLDGEGKEIE